MGLKTTPSRKSIDQVSISITSALVSAVLEWFLMLMLCIDASFSYLVTRFARRCQLQVPCLLCSRLDHVLGNERRGFYWDLICHNHKLNISSLILCRLHNNLVDLHLTCESCFCSSKFVDTSYDAEDIAASGMRRCICCNKQGVLFRNKSTEFKSAEVDALTLSLNSKCNRDEVSGIDPGLSRLDYTQNKDEDPQPNVEYTKIKVNSDTDAENQSSDDGMNASVQDLTGESIIKESRDADNLSLQDSAVAYIEEEHRDNAVDYCNNAENLAPSETSLNAITTTDLKQKGCNDEETSGIEHKHQTDLKPIETETCSHKPDLLDLGDAYKVVVGARLRQLSGKLLEQQKSMTESTKASEDLKLLLSQLSSSAARGFELPFNDISPRVSINSDDSKAVDASAFQLLQRRISLERNESNLSLDGSIVSEIEGENLVDKLKRQVEHDKKIMSSLYKELEEERNASAVAANQAMAMITRLQEEKASLHMEALQYLRMMEEQAEYDGEALQKANDLLSEREKQVRDFESELEIYRRRETTSQTLGAGCLDSSTTALDNDENDTIRRSRLCLQEFEDAKQFILQHLKKLELKLSMISKDELEPIAHYLAEETVDENPSMSLDNLMGSQENDRTKSSKNDKEGSSKFSSGTDHDTDYDLSVLRQELSTVIRRLEAIGA